MTKGEQMRLCKNIGIASTLSLVAATAFGCATPLDEQALAIGERDTTVLLVGHEVMDFDDWYPVFRDVGEPLRIEHEASGHRLFRSLDNPNFVSVAVEFPTPDDLFGFVSDPALIDEMDQAGVLLDTVNVVLSEEVEAITYPGQTPSPSAMAPCRRTPGPTLPGCSTVLLVSHDVEDFDDWYPVFTAVGEPLRIEHGATGHRLFRSLDDPNHVVVHVEFPTPDDLFGFVSDPALLDEMEQAGVVVETVNVVFSDEVEWLGYLEAAAVPR